MIPEALTSEKFLLQSGKTIVYSTIICLLLSIVGSAVVYKRAEQKHRKPPGPIPQFINKLMHREPFSFLFHGIFWSCILVIGCPLAGFGLILLSIWKGFKYLVFRTSMVDAIKGDKEMAVYITGCDSGFGKDLALALSTKGYVVFAGCLSEDGMKQYEGMNSVIRLKVDVTKEADSQLAATAVSDWLASPPAQKSNKKTRVLHCIVNNAGIGNIGLIDWLDLSTFRKLMDVNCFGTIRTVKAFLPLFKNQAFANLHPDARIVNVVSLAGLISTTGACAYSSSKHAADAFTSCLRLEMKAFKVPVVSVNPSWHQTPLAESTGDLLDQVWSRLSPETQEEYGEEFFSSFSQTFLDK